MRSSHDKKRLSLHDRALLIFFVLVICLGLTGIVFQIFQSLHGPRGVIELTLSGGRAQGLNVSLTVKEVAGVGVNNFPITSVVPLPRGAYQNTSMFRVVDVNGTTVPAQFDIVNLWTGDNSIRHLKIEFQPTVSAYTGTSASGVSVYHLKDDGTGTSAPATAVTVQDQASQIVVTTGPLALTIKKNAGFNIFDRVALDLNGNGTFESSEIIINSNSQNGGTLTGVNFDQTNLLPNGDWAPAPGRFQILNPGIRTTQGRLMTILHPTGLLMITNLILRGRRAMV